MEYLKILEKIDNCFYQLSGKYLPSPPHIDNRYEWLHEEAPYSILAHNADPDPHFIYVNKYALSCFKYTNEEMLSIPSRLSAGERDRAERQRLLEIVTKDEIAYGYEGLRVDKYGSYFPIYNGIVWQLKDVDNQIYGQGALFRTEKEDLLLSI